MTAAEPPAKPKPRAAFAFILVSVALATLASSIIGPVLPQLLKTLTHGSMSRMSEALGALIVLFAVMQFFAGPVQGALSDRYGRRPVILVANFGLAIDYVIMALAPNLAWLFVGRAVTGATAGSITAAYAYVADVTEPDQRAARFGQVASAISAGAAAGPLLGGLLGEFNPRAPFWAAAVLSVLCGLYGVFVLPESLAPEDRAPLKFHAMHPIGAVTSIWRDYPVLIGWQSAMFIMAFGYMGVNSIFLLYVTYRFGWTPQNIGLYTTFIVLTGLGVQAGLVGRTVKLLGERATLLTGMTVEIIAIVAAGFAVTGLQFSAAIFVLMLSNVAEPARTAIMNRIIGPSDRGRLSGASRSIASLTGILAPLPFALIFAGVSHAKDPRAVSVGLPFFISAAILAAAFAVTLRALRRSPVAASA
jgi:DHA1 family tetracycline resistance protein-like MFS transporter